MEPTINSETSECSLCVWVYLTLVHVCGLGSRRALRRPVRYLTNNRELLKSVDRKCYRTHECFSEFVSMAPACIGTSSDSWSRE